MLTDSLKQKEQMSRLAYLAQLGYSFSILFLFVAILTLVFGVFDEKMSFLTIFGEDSWKPIDTCSTAIQSVLFNTWAVLLLYTAFLVLLAGLPMYVSLPPHWLPFELWKMIHDM